MEFTNKQMDMLTEMSDIHFLFLKKYTPDEDIKYSEVLQMNHIKMIDIVDACDDFDEDMINFIFESIILDYKEMLNDGFDPEM